MGTTGSVHGCARDFAWRLGRRQDGSKYGFGVNARPITEDAFISGLPARKISLRGKAGGEIKIQAGVVLEPEVKISGTGVGEELDEFYDPSLGLGENQFGTGGSASLTGPAPEGFGKGLRIRVAPSGLRHYLHLYPGPEHAGVFRLRPHPGEAGMRACAQDDRGWLIRLKEHSSMRPRWALVCF